MSNDLNKVIEGLIVSNGTSIRELVLEAFNSTTLTGEAKAFLVAQGEFDASISGGRHGRYGFTNGNSDLQNKSNDDILAGIPLSEQ